MIHVGVAGATRLTRCCFGAMLLTAVVVAGCDGLLLPDPSVRYIAFGDSSTAGASGGDYVDFLPDLLGQPAEQFVNQGNGGETVSEGLERLRQLLSGNIYPNAEVLLYWEGGVDLIGFIRQVDRLLLFSPTGSSYPYSRRLDEALNGLQANIEAAIGAGQGAGLTVYVATYFSVPEVLSPCDALFLDVMLPSQAQNANAYVSLLNERIRQAAANTGAVVVDVSSVDATLRGDPANYTNCNHLSAPGNEIVARVFAAALGQAVAE